MSNTDKVFEFIKDKQPVTRQEVLDHFQGWNQRTTYRHIRILTQSNRVFLNKNKQLTTVPSEKFWQLHETLTQYQDINAITHAYAMKDPKLIELATALLQDKGPVLAELLVNTVILLNVLNFGFELSQSYQELNEPKVSLEDYFKELNKLLSSDKPN